MFLLQVSGSGATDFYLPYQATSLPHQTFLPTYHVCQSVAPAGRSDSPVSEPLRRTLPHFSLGCNVTGRVHVPNPSTISLTAFFPQHGSGPTAASRVMSALGRVHEDFTPACLEHPGASEISAKSGYGYPDSIRLMVTTLNRAILDIRQVLMLASSISLVSVCQAAAIESALLSKNLHHLTGSVVVQPPRFSIRVLWEPDMSTALDH